MSKLYYQVGTWAFLATTVFYAIQSAQLEYKLKEEISIRPVVDNTDFSLIDSLECENKELKKVVDLYHHVLADELEYNDVFFDTIGEMDAFDNLYYYYESRGIDYFSIIYDINSKRVK